MPSTLLFAINSEGRVFGLSSNGTKWREFIYLGLEFKQLSAVPNFLWAVGGDRQIYVHAHGLDIPIRVKEESYENERWSPFEGFSKRLLPTDRYSFSNNDGTIERSLKKIRLPSMAWQWEGDWKLELTLDGQPLDPDGWSYAVDFPATYHPTKQWSSYVRRRKWVRYRRYIALNSWCAIAPLHKDPTKEPFIGVAVGGSHLPGSEDGTILVWAVTASGRVMFRTNVSNSCPEGQRWSSVTMPPACEVIQISVGATGLVWAVLWNGKALVRTGITRECFIGSSWAEVDQPGESLILNQISIGCNGLWAITRDSRVWFRKGIHGESSGFSENLAKGTGWIEMFGNMATVSVAANDQVWAIGAEDKILYFRTSVTQEDLMGKTWRPLGAPTQLSRASSSVSLKSRSNGTPRHRSWATLNRQSAFQDTHSGGELDLSETCHSAPAVAVRTNLWQKSSAIISAKSCSSVRSSASSESSLPCNEAEISESGVDASETILQGVNEVKEYGETNDVGETVNSDYDNVSHPVRALLSKEIAVPTRSWSPQYAGGTVVAAEAHNAVDSIVFESDEFVGVYSEHGEREDEDDHLYWADSEAFWSSVEAGACLININSLPNWFLDTSARKKSDLFKPWRMKILNELRGRLPGKLEGLENYEKAIESPAWVKSGHCKCLLPGKTNFKDCILELEWVGSKGETLDCGTLTLSSPSKEDVLAQINMRDVTVVVGCGTSRNPCLALHSHSRTALKLQFGTEDEYEEWKSELSSICCRIKNISGVPSSQSIWVTTTTGDIFACDLSHIAKEQSLADRNDFFVERTFAGCEMPIAIPLQAGFLSGSCLTVWGCVRDKAKRFSIDLIASAENGTTNIAYHFNPRFDEDIVVQNSMTNLVWGQEERSRIMPFLAGDLFELEIVCVKDCFAVSVNGKKFTEFSTRKFSNNDPESKSPPYVTHLHCRGDINVTKVRYSSKETILEPRSMFWRQIEGHLKKVETTGGITWGIGFDNTAWLYLSAESSGSRKMCDTRCYYVYENQRWNPLTGYTSHGLPTDRFMWSDVTGKHKRTRENTTLLSKKWRWVNDWTVDFHTPGGVDKDGWQYAMDFPSSYHGAKNLTDYVRRRRWVRCAKLETVGPWIELGYTPLSDCSLYSAQGEVNAWAVASNGYVLFRKGVSKICPAGISWEHVSTDEHIISISCGPKQVWAVAKSGVALCRIGITAGNPLGDAWQTIEAPINTSLKQIAVGECGVWALDVDGRVSTRSEVSDVIPFGSHWRMMPPVSQEQDQSTIDEWSSPAAFVTGGFRQIAAKNKLWAVTSAGRLAYRAGVGTTAPAGFLWLFGIDLNLVHTSG